MSEPDLSTLPARMRYAAGVLEDAAARYWGYPSPDFSWAPAGLRNLAVIFDDQDRATVEREQMAADLIRDLQAVESPNFGLAEYIDIATHLVDAGWTKADK